MVPNRNSPFATVTPLEKIGPRLPNCHLNLVGSPSLWRVHCYILGHPVIYNLDRLQEENMKRVLTSAALCVMLALGLAAPAALASDNNGGGKAVVQMTPRAEAIKKCNDD